MPFPFCPPNWTAHQPYSRWFDPGSYSRSVASWCANREIVESSHWYQDPNSLRRWTLPNYFYPRKLDKIRPVCSALGSSYSIVLFLPPAWHRRSVVQNWFGLEATALSLVDDSAQTHR